MTSTKIKIIFFLFLTFFGIWVTLLYSGFLSSTLVSHPSIPTAILFMVSGGIAAVSCGVIGVDYLGIHLEPNREDSTQTSKDQNLALQNSQSNIKDVQKLPELPTIIINVKPELINSATTPKNQSFVFQDSQINTAEIQKPQELSTTREHEEIRQYVFSCAIRNQTTVLKYVANKINIGNISVEVDKRKRMHYRDVVSGRFVNKIEQSSDKSLPVIPFAKKANQPSDKTLPVLPNL